MVVLFSVFANACAEDRCRAVHGHDRGHIDVIQHFVQKGAQTAEVCKHFHGSSDSGRSAVT